MSTDPEETRRDTEWAGRVQAAVMKPVAEEFLILLRPIGRSGFILALAAAIVFFIVAWLLPPDHPLDRLDASGVTAYWAGPASRAPGFHDPAPHAAWDDLLIERTTVRAAEEDPVLEGLVEALRDSTEGGQVIPAADKDRVVLLRLDDGRTLTLWVGRSEGPVPVSGSFVATDGTIQDVQVWSDILDRPLVDLERLVARVEARSAPD